MGPAVPDQEINQPADAQPAGGQRDSQEDEMEAQQHGEDPSQGNLENEHAEANNEYASQQRQRRTGQAPIKGGMRGGQRGYSLSWMDLIASV